MFTLLAPPIPDLTFAEGYLIYSAAWLVLAIASIVMFIIIVRRIVVRGLSAAKTLPLRTGIGLAIAAAVMLMPMTFTNMVHIALAAQERAESAEAVSDDREAHRQDGITETTRSHLERIAHSYRILEVIRIKHGFRQIFALFSLVLLGMLWYSARGLVRHSEDDPPPAQ